MADDAWSLAEAKAKLSEVVDRARTQGPQHITRHGKNAAVIVSPEEWARRTATPRTLYEFLERSPLRGSALELERDPDVGRETFFE